MDDTNVLSFGKRFSYGVGHVLNDLCASMWFSFLLVYLHSVLQFSNKLAGYLLLLGQVVDALCTPLVGYESDRTKGCGNYGRRKTWHLIGSVTVMVSFPFIFNKCFGCTLCTGDTGEAGQPCWVQFIYYAPFVAIFQFGWASTQISHLSLIPELTPNENERVELNAIRYAFTVMSNLLVYCSAWILLGQASGADLVPTDQKVFTILSVLVVLVGAVFVTIFHIGTKEKYDPKPAEGSMVSPVTEVPEQMVWKDWFKELQFYEVGALYMFTRLAVNLSQVYMPMYITGTLNLEKHYIAIVPLVIFLSGFIISFVQTPMNKYLGRKVTYLIGGLIVLGSCVFMHFLHKDIGYLVIAVGVLLGTGTSTILVCSLSITADLIGNNCNTGAFVYGSMSFLDKMSNGIAIALIQYLHPCKTQACCPACVWYYRDVMVFVLGGMTLAALLVLIVLALNRHGPLNHNEHEEGEAHAPLLRDDQEHHRDHSNTDDCCDFGACFGSSSDAQARSVHVKQRPVNHASTTGLPDYGSINSESI